MSTILNLQVVAGADDTESAATNDWNSTTYNQMGIYAKGGFTKSYMTFRFPNVQLPVGIELISVTFQPYISFGSQVPTVIYFENADNPIAPISDADLSGRPLSAGELWTTPFFNIGFITSVELRAILHRVVDRGGWERGNAIQVHWRPYNCSDGTYISVGMYDDGGATYAAKLSITYKETSKFFSMFP